MADDPSPRARLLALAQAALAELRVLQETGRVAGWHEDAWWGNFPWLVRVKELSDLALQAGAPKHYRRLRELVDQPWSRERYHWRLTEIIAAVAELGLWCRSPEGAEPAAAKRAAPRPTAPVAASPGRRLRGGREIMEALEGRYDRDAWRAFKREAVKFNAPVEWPKGKGHPRAFENPLRAWWAERAAAAEAATEVREGRDSVQADRDGRPRAYTGGDDQPLGLAQRPKGRNPAQK